ncbi:4Fe-4S dicluster domain-containing protein [Desulfosporosinus meridiei]|uniref:Fe-S-cluster-containing hydrogenase subunit n=1 Tax=Desulfosporosinus meridiei (strain ATCC BAA-275 / DSM 13257 / KCTC 12902 / NCIMB 13706 / S10) TaxID=768704 RepID=J7J5K6_DESMD|nr:4Fe-4S dicluster domain-containing protein [Desulfosporosinus meridiei]AFQ46226.1 Fe-S-cluster-containing hydrogenase subunit [Desulfosporosinus meridiei DSM 13257]
MVKQLGFILDTNRCLGCGACIKACQINNQLPAPLKWRQIRQVEKAGDNQIQRFFLSTACNHCANPECLKVCPAGAYYKRRDGIVLHNSEKCTGCQSCVGSCPFNAPQLNPFTQKAGKCQLCYDRLDQGKSPHCVQACLTGALQLHEIRQTENNQLLRLTAQTPSLRLTQPAVFYKPPRPTEL